MGCSFIRRPNDWEMGGVDDFLHTLGSNLPPTKNGDQMRQKLTKNRDFDVRSFYNKIRRPLPIIFLWKGVWKVKAPRRVSFLVWTAAWDKILIVDNLRGRGMDLLTGALCVVIMRRRWIICSSTVVRLIGCGVQCLDLLGFHGSCQERLLILSLVGGIGQESIRLAFGIQFLCA